MMPNVLRPVFKGHCECRMYIGRSGQEPTVCRPLPLAKPVKDSNVSAALFRLDIMLP